MRRNRYPPPSKSAERVLEYLEMIKLAQDKEGFAKKYDFLRKAMNEAQANRMIKTFTDWGFISESADGKYHITRIGEDMLELLRKRHLVGLLTKELSGDRIRRW